MRMPCADISQFRHPDEFETAEEEDSDAGEVDLVLGGVSRGFQGELCDCHPPLASVSTLMDIYVDRIDPLVKILHIPSFTLMVLAGAKAAEMEMDKEAAVFCWYFSTGSVMDEEECVRILGEGKEVLFAKYRAIARHTLGRARLLSTTSLMTLHAFYLFLVREATACPYFGCWYTDHVDGNASAPTARCAAYSVWHWTALSSENGSTPRRKSTWTQHL